MNKNEHISQKPVDIARVALLRMGEAGLPPTPENFSREYHRVAGADFPLPAIAEPEIDKDHGTADSLRDILKALGETTDGLARGVEKFDDGLKPMLSEVDELGPDGVRSLLQRLNQSRLELEDAVRTSRAELDTTRGQLEQVRADLERSRAQARIDPLTGFTNRRGMEEIVAREIARAQRACTPFSLAMLDIDHFKRVNDEYGHDVGDRALVHLATVAKSGLRDTDVICRYGGEEFVVVLPDSGAQGAQYVVDRLRSMVERTPLLLASDKLYLRLSAGIAEWTTAEARDSLLQRADKALYEAKRAGRNRVVVAQARAAA